MSLRLLFATEYLAQPIGGGQPARPLLRGESRQPLALDHIEHGQRRDGADGARELALQADGLRHQPAQACHLTRVGRFTADCVRHGRVIVDECSYPSTCPRDHEGSR